MLEDVAGNTVPHHANADHANFYHVVPSGCSSDRPVPSHAIFAPSARADVDMYITSTW
jgi:hypothetical protein